MKKVNLDKTRLKHTEKNTELSKNIRYIRLLCMMFACNMMIYFLVKMIGFTFDTLKDTYETERKIVEIQSVDLRTTNNGEFALGFGYIDDDEYYYVYQITDDSGKKLEKYKANYVTIYDNLEEGKQPYIDITDLGNIKMYLPKNIIKEEYDVNINQ